MVRSRGRVAATVIVPVAGLHYPLLGEQLRQLARQQGDIDFEVIVADNTGALRSPVAGPPGTRVIDASSSPGPAFARNVAAEAAAGEVLLFCDADDLVAPGWVAAHCRALESAAFTGGALVELDQTDPLFVCALGGSWAAEPLPAVLWRHEGVPFAATANCGVRREVFHAVGGFPGNYRWAEDVAFSLRMVEAGHPPTVVPGADVLKRARPTDAGRRQRMVGLGSAHVALRRDFEVGPPLPVNVMRATARAVVKGARALASRDPQVRAGRHDHRWRLEGTLRELVRPGTNEPTA